MKRQIRFGVFETNSSNINTLTIMTDKEYKEYMDKWLSDEWMWDMWMWDWVRTEDIEVCDKNKDRYSNDPCDNGWGSIDKEVVTYTTEHGDKIVAVSIYGQDC